MINIDVILMNKNGGCPQISKLGQNDDQLEEFWGCPEVSAYFTKHQEVCGLPQIDMDHTDFEIEIINHKPFGDVHLPDFPGLGLSS